MSTLFFFLTLFTPFGAESCRDFEVLQKGREPGKCWCEKASQVLIHPLPGLPQAQFTGEESAIFEQSFLLLWIVRAGRCLVISPLRQAET